MTNEEIALAKTNLQTVLTCSPAVADTLFSELSEDKQKACAKGAYEATYVVDTAKMYIELLKRDATITSWVS